MKKQKLTRKSLDELAKIMPVLREDERRVCIGGDLYYTEDGRYLGQVGSGTNMRITNEHVFEHSQYDESNLINGSSSFGDSSAESKSNTILELASGMGVPFVSFYSGPATQGAKWDPDMGVMLNTNTKWFQSGNYYEIKVMLRHEQQHLLNPIPAKDRVSEATKAPYEARAYERIIGSSDFQRTSPEFQQGILASYKEVRALLPPNWEPL